MQNYNHHNKSIISIESEYKCRRKKNYYKKIFFLKNRNSEFITERRTNGKIMTLISSPTGGISAQSFAVFDVQKVFTLKHTLQNNYSYSLQFFL